MSADEHRHSGERGFSRSARRSSAPAHRRPRRFQPFRLVLRQRLLPEARFARTTRRGSPPLRARHIALAGARRTRAASRSAAGPPCPSVASRSVFSQSCAGRGMPAAARTPTRTSRRPPASAARPPAIAERDEHRPRARAAAAVARRRRCLAPARRRGCPGRSVVRRPRSFGLPASALDRRRRCAPRPVDQRLRRRRAELHPADAREVDLRPRERLPLASA